MRGSLRAVHGTLTLLAHWRCQRLPGEEHWVDIWLRRSENSVPNEGDQNRHYSGGVNVPLPCQVPEAGIERLK